MHFTYFPGPLAALVDERIAGKVYERIKCARPATTVTRPPCPFTPAA
jgi:hypothetical protein